jgi:squalene-associated FAD-dependent desaturase
MAPSETVRSAMLASGNKSLHVAIVGGGLAGLAAGCALAEAGCRISLYERRPYLGGRASSYQHPGTGEVVDNCQHVLLGCCTNLIDLYRRTGVEDKIRWYDELTFLEPGGRASHIRPSFLPAPLHNGPSFLGAHCLGLRDKISIGRVMAALLRRVPADNGQSFLEWLQNYAPTPAALERFWKPILISALNEDLDRVSVFYAGQVIRESFMKSAAAGRMGIPAIPLSDLYAAGAGYIQSRGGEVFLRASVEALVVDDDLVRLKTAQGEVNADAAVLAVTSDVALKLLPESLRPEGWTASSDGLGTSPIAGIHLWFDRQISELDHAVLLDRTIQWMFHKSRIQAEVRGGDSAGGSYVELVVSAAKSLVNLSKNEIVELAVRELREFFPAAREAQLVKSTVIKEIHATFSPGPGVDRLRPAQATALARVFLAGDWTATGWPATMEGAVRSGYRAAEIVIQSAGLKATRVVVPNLAAAGLMRIFDK